MQNMWINSQSGMLSRGLIRTSHSEQGLYKGTVAAGDTEEKHPRGKKRKQRAKKQTDEGKAEKEVNRNKGKARVKGKGKERAKDRGRKRGGLTGCRQSGTDSEELTDWSKADNEDELQQDNNDNESDLDININISTEAYKRLFYIEQRAINITRNKLKLKPIVQDIQKVLPLTKRELQQKEKEERRKRRKQAVSDNAEERGQLRRSSRFAEQFTNDALEDTAKASMQAPVEPTSDETVKNPPRSLNPLHWPELYKMALEYVDNDKGFFPQFEERLSTKLFAKHGLKYDYECLQVLFKRMWAGETDQDTIRKAILDVRSMYVGVSSINADTTEPRAASTPPLSAPPSLTTSPSPSISHSPTIPSTPSATAVASIAMGSLTE
ncbi:hypothetical protein PQX77_016787 [Marasmius sp. AFHP31]|nr:hypothetical protein PQX77_016787 [Marasmius sp. AFHP31]